MTVATYDPRDVRVTFNGMEFTGFVDGALIEVERDPVPRTPSRKRAGSIELTLVQQGGDLRNLWDWIDAMPVPEGVQVQRWELARMIKRAIRRWRRKVRMQVRRRRGRGATSA